MIVLVASFGTALVAALLAWAAAATWWRWDTAAPSLSPGTVATQATRHARAVRWVSARFDPEVTTGTVLATVGAVVVIGGIGLGLLVAMVRTHRGFADFDTAVARFGASHATPYSTHVLRIVTQVGGAWVVIPLSVVVGVVEARRLRAWSVVWFLGIVVGGQYALADGIKA